MYNMYGDKHRRIGDLHTNELIVDTVKVKEWIRHNFGLYSHVFDR